MNMQKGFSKLFLLSFFLLIYGITFGQNPIVFGTIKDYSTKNLIEFVTIHVEGGSRAVESDAKGYYRVEVEQNKPCHLIFNRLGYKEERIYISSMPIDGKRNINIELVTSESELEIEITASRIEDVGMVREEVTELKLLPTASGNFESVLPAIALGVSASQGGELSSQYNVRGGNYDENLIYVNDFEIFRPQLIRSGNQEGLSFPNIDLIRDISFSSGGYESKYGDKMSSVLDVRYKRPDKFGASVTGSLLGAAAHIEGSKRLGANAYNKLRFLAGVRYKTTRYLLGSLDVEGEYIPDFVDLQSYITYDITRDLQIGLIGNYNSSVYDFTPKTRETSKGGFGQILRLSTFYEGGETDEFVNGMGGLSLTYVPSNANNPTYFKLLASHYQSSESEAFDILGYYRLSEIEIDLSGDGEATEEVGVLGTGLQHTYTRNYLFNTITNIQHKGGIEFVLDDDEARKSNFVQWGVKYQRERYEDDLNEWERLDSAGYSIPYLEDSVVLNQSLRTINELSNEKITAFVQNSYSYLSEEEREFKVTTGLRSTYVNLSEEFLFSPRFQFQYRPISWNENVSFKLAGGVYYQVPFYRELRRLDGTINEGLKSQKSIHFVAGASYDFFMKNISKKPFRLITELYYKSLSNLVSYDVDNVRIRYSGENDATGYAMGLDVRINGEFVPDAESWINLSFLRTRESLDNIQHLERVDGQDVEIDDVPRPTDKFFNLSMFFQDYLQNNKNVKMNLGLSVGTGLPFGFVGNNEVYRNSFRFNTYHRVDAGFSFLLWDKKMKERKPNHPLRNTKSAWISFEVFNLLQVANEASNTWIKTITNGYYAIPNNLTSRRLNLKLKVEF